MARANRNFEEIFNKFYRYQKTPATVHECLRLIGVLQNSTLIPCVPNFKEATPQLIIPGNNDSGFNRVVNFKLDKISDLLTS